MSLRSRNNTGFSLLEVLISIVLLVVISFSIFQAISETYKLRDVITHEGDFYNGIRLAMNVVQRDIELLYSPLLMKPEEKKSNRPPSAEVDQELPEYTPSEFFGPPVDKTGIRPTRFFGSDSKLSFVSASHVRVYKDATETDLNKIGYALDTDTDQIPEPGLKMLIKTSSTAVFNYDELKDNSKRKYPLLHGIKKLQFRFYQKEKQQWYSSWDSEKSDFKDKMPDAVEVKLEVLGPSNLNFEGTYRFKPEMPFNGLAPTT